MMIKIILTLLPLLAEVESNFDPNAIGDGGKAIGMYQIHEDYWMDGTDWIDVNWEYHIEYVKNPTYSTVVVIGYLDRYGRNYEKKTGQPATMEVLARIHNGGPRGYEKESTKEYWRKIEALIDRKEKP